MSGKSRVGGLRVKNVEAALQAEEEALSTIHRAVDKQLKRLEVEEQLLIEMLKGAEAEEVEAERRRAAGCGGDGDEGAETRQPQQAQQRRGSPGAAGLEAQLEAELAGAAAEELGGPPVG